MSIIASRTGSRHGFSERIGMSAGAVEITWFLWIVFSRLMTCGQRHVRIPASCRLKEIPTPIEQHAPELERIVSRDRDVNDRFDREWGDRRLRGSSLIQS